MKDEIKEIVVDNGELIAYYKDGSFQAFDTLLQEVLDYITNLQEQIEIKSKGFKATVEELCETSEKLEHLQEENERLKKEKKKLSNDLAEAILFNQKRCEQNKELKQRIDKAIKIIQNDTTLNPPRQRDRLINLLNGGDEE